MAIVPCWEKKKKETANGNNVAFEIYSDKLTIEQKKHFFGTLRNDNRMKWCTNKPYKSRHFLCGSVGALKETHGMQANGICAWDISFAHEHFRSSLKPFL